MDNVVFEWLLGILVVPFVNWLKGKLNLQGPAAMFLTFGVSIVMGLVYLFLTGDLAAIDWTNASELVGKILAAATLVYNLLLPVLEKSYASIVKK